MMTWTIITQCLCGCCGEPVVAAYDGESVRQVLDDLRAAPDTCPDLNVIAVFDGDIPLSKEWLRLDATRNSKS